MEARCRSWGFVKASLKRAENAGAPWVSHTNCSHQGLQLRQERQSFDSSAYAFHGERIHTSIWREMAFLVAHMGWWNVLWWFEWERPLGSATLYLLTSCWAHLGKFGGGGWKKYVTGGRLWRVWKLGHFKFALSTACHLPSLLLHHKQLTSEQ